MKLNEKEEQYSQYIMCLSRALGGFIVSIELVNIHGTRNFVQSAGWYSKVIRLEKAMMRSRTKLRAWLVAGCRFKNWKNDLPYSAVVINRCTLKVINR